MTRSALLVFVLLLAIERPVGAYLDPGTGSMLLQALLGGVAAIGVVGRLYWRRVAAVFERMRTQRTKR